MQSMTPREYGDKSDKINNNGVYPRTCFHVNSNPVKKHLSIHSKLEFLKFNGSCPNTLEYFSLRKIADELYG